MCRKKDRYTHSIKYFVFQIITTDEAERRGHVYDRQGSTYLFDLDYVEDVYTVDAAHQGNVSHFVNHSVSDNVKMYANHIINSMGLYCALHPVIWNKIVYV